MADFNLKIESIDEILDYNVLVSTYDNKAEQRRLKPGLKLLGFRIKSPALTKSKMQEYRNFLISKYGALTKFTFESPFDDIIYNVRFERGSFKTTFKDGYFECEFVLIRIP